MEIKERCTAWNMVYEYERTASDSVSTGKAPEVIGRILHMVGDIVATIIATPDDFVRMYMIADTLGMAADFMDNVRERFDILMSARANQVVFEGEFDHERLFGTTNDLYDEYANSLPESSQKELMELRAESRSSEAVEGYDFFVDPLDGLEGEYEGEEEEEEEDGGSF